MIHKFISNDNQGNVNTLEIGSDYTKISKVVDPVNDDDVANKKYVDQAGDNRFFVTLTVNNMDPIQATMNYTIGEIEDAYNAGKRIIFRLSLVEGEWFYSEANIAYSNGDIFMVECISIIDGFGLLFGYTSGTSDKTATDFAIDIYYSLTPAS